MRLSESDPLTNPLEKESDFLEKQSSSAVEESTDTEGKGFPARADNVPAEPPRRGFASVLLNRNFLTLWSGQVFSQIADKVYLVLSIALINTRFQPPGQSISAWVSALMMAFTIPAVLFGSLAGVYVDRWSKKAVLAATNLVRGVLVLVMPILLWITRDWTPICNLPIGFYVLLGLTFVISTLNQFFAPAEQAVIPLIVKERDLLSANSLYTTTMMGSLIIGFAVGEPLLALTDNMVHHLGIGQDYGRELVVGGSYAIAGVLLLMMKTGENRQAIQGEPPHVWQDIREGLSYVNHHPRIRNATIQLIVLFSIFAALAVLAVRLAETLPGLKPSQFGFLLAGTGVGLACGAALLGHWGEQFSHARLSLYGSIGVAGSLGALALFTHHLWATLLVTTLIGGFAALVGIPMQTTIQAETPKEMRGKVFGLQNNAINIALSFPLALAGVAETLLGLETVFFGLAAIAIAGGVLNWYISGTGTAVSTQADN